MSTQHASNLDLRSEDGRTRTYDGSRTEHRTFTETKLGAKTSEFYFAIIAIAGILIATYADGDDSLVLDDGWRMAAFVAAAYIISRGLAKLGTREPYRD